jgi:predicted permease
MLLATLFTVVLSKALYSSRDKKGTILASLSIIGNTGNLGIPLGLALFGVESLPYTSIINIANIFFIYTVSLFILAKDHYSPREAIRSIGSIPVIYVAVGAIFWNIEGFAISDEVLQVLQMGAYASIVIQLVIFGLYLSDIDSREFNIKLHLSVNLSKFLTLPLIGVAVIYLIGYEDRFESKVLIMELMMPLAVNSVNMATLYRSDPKSVTSLILSSSILFIALFLLFGSYL